MSYEKAEKAIRMGKCRAALKLLKSLPATPDGTVEALTGLAHFRRQQYGAAAKHYKNATEADPTRTDWDEMYRLARANCFAQIRVEIPKSTMFDGEKLLARPSKDDTELPRPEPLPKSSFVKRFRLFLGWVLGLALTRFMNWLTDWVGEKFGYRAKVWTNWYGRPLPLQVLTLAYMREQLNANNLRNTYPDWKLVGFQPRDQTPPMGVSHFRTADGSWNNLENPKEGAAGTRFLRNVAPTARPETDARVLEPNPREVSRLLLARPIGADGRPVMQEVAFLNLFAASWIQFMLHDWVNHGDTQPKNVLTVPLLKGDPARDRYLQDEITVGRTQVDPTRNDQQEPAATSFINEVTHWWDGSQIYGSDKETQKRVRSDKFGKLKLSEDGKLPTEYSTKVEEAGFRRNWWVGLSMLHTLFVREHNAICDMLQENHPDWGDDRLFNVARLINAAVMAKIHSIEWTPAILPNRALDTGLNVNWYGLLTYATRRGKERTTLSEVNVRNAEIGGIVGNPIEKHGCPFGLTEEFVEVYRLHSLLPEALQLRRRGSTKVKEVPFIKTRQRGSTRITNQYPMSDLFYSFGKQQPGALQLNNYPRFMQELSVAGNPFFDLGAVDILRARERGVPRYNEFRRQLGLNPIRSFDDLTTCPDVLAKLRLVYGDKPDRVDDLDLLIGTLAESQRPTAFGFGETLFQIFILNASRRLQADRFYTDSYNEDVYTAEGLSWIDRTDFKTVILRHYPELADTGLANIKNAFEPWDEGPELDPTRHPLRAWDPELKEDRWRGDAYSHA
jgi:hypothetical protein